MEKTVNPHIGQEINVWQVTHMKVGLADLKAGKTAPHDKVAGWLKTWSNSAAQIASVPHAARKWP